MKITKKLTEVTGCVTRPPPGRVHLPARPRQRFCSFFQDLRRVAEPAGGLLHKIALSCFLPVLALIANHALYAGDLEQFTHFGQLP